MVIASLDGRDGVVDDLLVELLVATAVVGGAQTVAYLIVRAVL